MTPRSIKPVSRRLDDRVLRSLTWGNKAFSGHRLLTCENRVFSQVKGVSEGGLEPPFEWYITETVIHHQYKLTHRRAARSAIHGPGQDRCRAVSRSGQADLRKRRAVRRNAARGQLGSRQRHPGVLLAGDRGNRLAPVRHACQPGRPAHHLGGRSSANRDQKPCYRVESPWRETSRGRARGLRHARGAATRWQATRTTASHGNIWAQPASSCTKAPKHQPVRWWVPRLTRGRGRWTAAAGSRLLWPCLADPLASLRSDQRPGPRAAAAPITRKRMGNESFGWMVPGNSAERLLVLRGGPERFEVLVEGAL